MVRVPKKPPVKKKATQVRAKKKPTGKVSLSQGGAPKASQELMKLATILSPE